MMDGLDGMRVLWICALARRGMCAVRDTGCLPRFRSV